MQRYNFYPNFVLVKAENNGYVAKKIVDYPYFSVK